MVVLPNDFVTTRYPGYFWHLKERKLYSIKSGKLKPLFYIKGGTFGGITVMPGYRVSVSGKSIKVSVKYLGTLKSATNEVIEISK